MFVESSAPETRWCREGTTTPTVDRFSTSGFDVTVTAYVVAPAEVPAADLVLRVSDLRNAGNAEGPWDRVGVGLGACPGDPAALCAPLG